MTIFDEKFDVKMTFVGGERVYQKKDETARFPTFD